MNLNELWSRTWDGVHFLAVKTADIVHRPEFTDQAIRGAPAVAGTVAAKWTMNEWLALATLVYVIIQAAYLLRKWWREEKKLREAKSDAA